MRWQDRRRRPRQRIAYTHESTAGARSFVCQNPQGHDKVTTCVRAEASLERGGTEAAFNGVGVCLTHALACQDCRLPSLHSCGVPVHDLSLATTSRGNGCIGCSSQTSYRSTRRNHGIICSGKERGYAQRQNCACERLCSMHPCAYQCSLGHMPPMRWRWRTYTPEDTGFLYQGLALGRNAGVPPSSTFPTLST